MKGDSFMSLKEWAEREIEIACKRENPDRKEGEFDYGRACYESALKAFNSLLEDGHSGMSIGFTKNILNRLIDGKPLTPIEDTDDVWKFSYEKDGVETYQCSRMRSLFKYVYPDGTVKYRDVDRFYCYEIGSDVPFSNGFINRIAEENVGEITMPYIPSDKPIKIYVGEYLVDPKNGDYDTLGILYCVYPDGRECRIYRYFKEVENSFEEIDEREWYERVSKALTRLYKGENDGLS